MKPGMGIEVRNVAKDINPEKAGPREGLVQRERHTVPAAGQSVNVGGTRNHCVKPQQNIPVIHLILDELPLQLIYPRKPPGH